MHAPSTENLLVNAFGPYLAAIHLQDLLDDAAYERRARLARKGQAAVPAWRRGLGSAFVSVGRSLDPTVEAPIIETSRAEGRSARAAA
jgi:hypothetical protein